MNWHRPGPLVEPLTGTESRLHVTVSPEFLALLKKAKAGESHGSPAPPTSRC